jgi:hypothetical protein
MTDAAVPVPGWAESPQVRYFFTWLMTPSGMAEVAAYRAEAAGATEGAALLRRALAWLLAERPFTTTDWLRLTGYQFYGADELYGFLGEVRAYYEGADARPRLPDPDRWPPAEFWGPPLPGREPPDLPELCDGPVPWFGRWYAAYTSDLASNRAAVALRLAALESRDLAPVLRFGTVYGPGEAALGQAEARSVRPVGPPAADGSFTFESAPMDAGALAFSVFHPADGVPAAGPRRPGQLVSSLEWAAPRPPIDPTSVPLADLGLDVPGVDRRFVHFCAGWLSANASDEFWELGRSFHLAWPDYRATVRTGLRHLVRHRPLDVGRWHDLTGVAFRDAHALTHYLADVRVHLGG